MDEEQNSAFAFEGNWKEYAPIAFTNLLLTIVTLGFYRFWATTRTRRYLWSQTRFIDDRLEWTGTGGELFKGFLMVLVVLGGPLLLFQLAIPALILRGMGAVAGILGFASIMLIFYLVGVARFRALRYRLSRTYWHGIRGGADDGGWKYGWSYVWKTTVGFLAFGLLVPRATMSLWNERWNKMSFGPHDFHCGGDYGPTMWKYITIYIVPVLGVGILGIFIQPLIAGGGSVAWGVVAAILLYAGIGFMSVRYYASFFYEGIKGLGLSTLDFHFSATTWDWIKLFLIDIVLVIGTLGIGLIFIQYRHWSFFIRHLEAYGEIDLDALTQSTTRESRHGEGLLDAMDVGAF